MLELKNITKTYPAAGQKVEALRGVSVQFRRNEFVSILGPSGCGKTTLLNIVGGLDQYTSGDLVIHGKSTREFKDRDWDAYRNHSIGFVFQSYNLIPHQSVLQNVELALTLSGVPKRERRARAREALERVGLGDQVLKKPSQLSGGQMQRVAIARAIVNNPDIILADEPTGALDTETGTQVMDVLKEIARDRLVIVVTHNATLAQRYATRILRMLDGRLVDDSKPLSEGDVRRELELDRQHARPKGKIKMPSMSLRTSFGLSLKNLFTKKSRTLLTSFAGSIGIIGIALIYAVSNGMTAYIDAVQEDTLSSYPLTLEAQHMDMGSLMQNFLDKAQSVTQHEQDGVYQKSMIYEMLNALSANQKKENDLKKFKQHLEIARADEHSDSPLKTAVSGVQYTYDTELLVYTKNVDGTILRSDPQELMQDILSEYTQADVSAMMEFRDSFMMGNSAAMDNMTALWREMLPGADGQPISPLFEKQYDLLYGAWPTQYNEIMLIVDKDGELSDLTLYALGLIPRENIDALMRAALLREPFAYKARGWPYRDICALDFRVILNADCYVQDAATGLYTDLRATDAGLKYLYDQGLKLKVSGILKPSDDAVATMLHGGLAYTSLLTEYLVDKGNASPVVQRQLQTPETDILTGLPFKGSGVLSDEAKARALRDHLAGLDEAGKAQAYLTIQSIPPEDLIAGSVRQQLAAIAARHGLTHVSTLTGFKWIARAPGLVYGYEEALGYCVAPQLVLDKDGVSAAVVLAEMVSELKAEGRTLADAIDDLARDYGVYLSSQVSARFDDVAQIPALMSRLLATPPATLAGSTVVSTDDMNKGFMGLPPTNGLHLAAKSGARVIIRPSGTEPKVKAYLEVIEPSIGGDVRSARARAQSAMAELRADVEALLGV